MDERNFKTQITRSSQDVLRFYDGYADTWDERFGSGRSTQEFHRIRVASFLEIANLKKTDRIVELGVGTGPYLNRISPLVEQITCIDGSIRMLEILRSKYKHVPNIRLLHLDLEQPLEGVSFHADLLYCFGLLEHIIDVNIFIANCKRMLRNGGRIIFVMPNGRSPWYRGIRLLWRTGRHCSTDKYYTKETLDGVMGRHGFAPDAFIYWGYFPAGVGDALYRTLKLIGKLLEGISLQRYAGGLTAAYVFKR